MKKTKILYVYGFGELPDSPIIKDLEARLDQTKYQIISDYYAQYDPKEALYDLNNYIKKHNIDIIIGENLGGYLVTLMDNNLQKILINPMYNPVLELPKCESYELDENGKMINVKSVPGHMLRFYSAYQDQPKYYDNTYAMFSQTDNYEEYSKVLKNCNMYKDIFATLSETLNNIGES